MMISDKRSPVQWHRLEKRRDAVKRQWKLLTDKLQPSELSQDQLKKELCERTEIFRSKLQSNKKEDDLLPEAFAVVCVAIESLFTFEEIDGKTGERKRKGIRLNDCQIMGGIALHDGRIIEMKTGEGKTLTAALPLYLNALSGKGCILVTTNEYLARRDAEEMFPLYDMLGLKEACGVPEEGSAFTSEQKKEIYGADIVYSTQKVLTGDYLQENRRSASEGRFLREEMNYCIVDEADAVLLDNASIPHIISGAPRAMSGDASDLIEAADCLVSLMKEAGDKEDGDYEVDGESVWLTEKGIRLTEEFFGIKAPSSSGKEKRSVGRPHGNSSGPNLFTPENDEVVKAVMLALRAHAVLERDKRYVVRDDRVMLLDVREGRLLPDNMLQSGQHQALEAKEHVPISLQMRSMASITFQSYFNMYRRLAGMTGTGVSDEEEFRSIYGLEVVKIPTYKTVARVDEPIRIYPRHDVMIRAAMEDILATHRTGQPVLIVAGSIQISEEMDEKLLDCRIPHSVLNAKNLAKEAAIISEAGQKGAVTVATAVAGRGTDIKLGEVNGKKPEKSDIENLTQHIRTLSHEATAVSRKRTSLMKDPEMMANEIRELKRVSRQIEEDIENLGEADVQKLGGLAVIVVGMTRNNRTELQARGRSGRRGDVGRSAFYASLEDDVVTENGPDWLIDYEDRQKNPTCPESPGDCPDMREQGAACDMPEEMKNPFIRRAVEGTRMKAEAQERTLRRQMRSVEDSVRQQREIIYNLRNHVLEDDLSEDPESQMRFCKQLANRVIEDYLKGNWKSKGEKDSGRLKQDLEQFAKDFRGDSPPGSSKENIEENTDNICEKEKAKEYLQGAAEKVIKEKFTGICTSLEKASKENIVSHREDGKLTDEQQDQIKKDVNRCLAKYIRFMKLKAIDDAWVEEVDYLQQLREIISGRRLAGRNMQREFSREAHKAYDFMAMEIERATLYNILFGSVTQKGGGEVEFRSPRKGEDHGCSSDRR